MRQLVIQLARFGDLVQTKRLLHSLLAEPGAEVHLCLDQSLAALARLLYPAVILHPVAAHGTALAKLPAREQAAALLSANLPVFRELAELDFGRVYNLNFSPLNFRVAGLFAPECVRGHVWSSGQEEIGQWARLAMRWSSMRRIGLNIVDFWAWHHPAPIPPEDVNPVAQGRGGGLGVVLAGRESRRSLPPKELARLIAALLETRADLNDKPVTLLGSVAEAKAAHHVLRELPARRAGQVRNLCGGTDWAGLVDTVGGLDLLLTPDTGTMHLAAALGVPVLATFLSSAWCSETGPYGQGHRVLQALTDCLPCLESQPCDFGVICLRPFGDARLTRYLATCDERHLPDGLLDLDTTLDAVGVDYTARSGMDPSAGLRHQFRMFLARHLGAGGTWEDSSVREFAERLYSERDWMTPDAESSQSRRRTSMRSLF
ncbi:MAG TPA: glycosyltransferase family 9 protein [Humidesulfovibrio sp.]|uniref:glycosyltransferase family 9 protein n=1 Tax=Humidesulfovibrio sp. TaxID=2910988 RepID=UPI002C34D8D3|nr:glycosyltransferase family 9 protein [Humidesulfovibrio sp.]HWR04222.1 glycosyltransferase family 9 protein [Humidesulfovibrio sp.]